MYTNFTTRPGVVIGLFYHKNADYARMEEMDNGKGGQAFNPPSWNAWGQAAAKKARQKQMDGAAGQPLISAAQQPPAAQIQQRNTASELARSRVLEAYGKHPDEYKANTEQSPAPQVNAVDWRKYHTAWQNYYQKYYGDYYGKAAQDYVAREKLRLERAATSESESVQTKEEIEEVQGGFREKIRKTAEKRAKRSKKLRRWLPLVLGGLALVCGVLLQYNQVIAANIVAYMSPGDNSSNTITALDPTLTIATHDSPYLMIPKLNVEVPVVFGSANDVASMNIAMGNGVANFAVPGASAKPGEKGNFVISGHSAGNVYQNTNYKFIFSGLPRMTEGDLIYMDYENKRYTYKMIGHTIVEPTDVNALVRIANDNPDKPLITLLTCYPLGTSRQRYIIYGEQINPAYDEESTVTPKPDDDLIEEEMMPKGDPSPLEQFWNWLNGKEY